MGIRFVNRTIGVLRFPTPRGGRIALAPGEFFTDTYYERFSRLLSEPNSGRRPLIKEHEDGTPVGSEAVPEVSGIVAPPSPVKTAKASVPIPPSGCATGCEAACQFPAETSVESVLEINQRMDKPPIAAKPFTEQPPPPQPLPPLLNEKVLLAGAEASVDDVLAHFGLTETDVLEVNVGYLKVVFEGKEWYVSRYELGWKTHHLPAMKSHVTMHKPLI